MRAYQQAIARDDAHDVDVRFATDPADIAAAVHLLDLAEDASRAPLVDEAERARLEQVAHHDEDPAAHWHPLLAWHGQPVGYAGLLLAPDVPSADVVVRDPAVVGVLLEALRRVAGEHDASQVLAWIRHADDEVLDLASTVGWELRRRLLVLWRDLAGAPVARTPFPDGVEVRHHDGTDRDDEGVAAVLAGAYADVPDTAWTPGEVARRRSYDWFRAEDLLVAHRAGRLLGVHWTKRRDHRSGEVYNLAVHPSAQGMGLGAALLDAGLDHLDDIDCTHVVLWVDETNVTARRLYASRGFEPAWVDVALGCATCGPVGDV